MMQAMIFAAGMGTRLKPLTDTMPKALVCINGKPLLWHVIDRLKQAGTERIVVNVHHFASQIVAYLHEHRNFGLDIRISDETEQLLETGGGIKKALPLFDPTQPILIHNVDILSNVCLEKLYAEGQKADATLLVSDRKTRRYLLFQKEGECRLRGWTNIETGEVRSPYCHLDPSACERLAFSGIHVFSPTLFPLLRDMPDRFGIMDFYLKYCGDTCIKGIVQPGLQLMDVGKADTLGEAEAFLERLYLK